MNSSVQRPRAEIKLAFERSGRMKKGEEAKRMALEVLDDLWFQLGRLSDMYNSLASDLRHNIENGNPYNRADVLLDDLRDCYEDSKNLRDYLETYER